jgi:hypothetical protein
MFRLRIPLIILFLLLMAIQAYSAQIPLSRWVNLRSDAREQVRDIIRSEVDSRERFSTSQEEKANLNAVEDEKEREDSRYKKGIADANREFNRVKKQRDYVTTQFQTVSTELEDQQKNIKTIKTGIENLDSQIARYNQDIKTQQDALKKWLQTEKQGEAVVAVIFTRGFKDAAHTLERLSDQASAPLMAQYMGAYIQSFTKVIDSVLSVDFIRAVEEGTATWNKEEPLRIELEKGNRGTTYLRLKRYELYPFQAPKGGQVKPPADSKNIHTTVVAAGKDLDAFLAKNGYAPANYDLSRAHRIIKDAAHINAVAGDGLQEQVRSFNDRINSLREKIASARSERGVQASLLQKREDSYKKTVQEAATVQSKKEEVDRAFQDAQKSLHDIRRVRESIIIKTALATTRGSQSPAEASAEAVIDKLAEVKNDAKTQHSTSTTEVTNFQVTAESSFQAVTEARIAAVRLISFINEGDSVRVKMAFRVRTVLEETGGGTVSEAPRPAPKPTGPAPKPTVRERLSRLIPPADVVDKKPPREPEFEKTAPPREPEPEKTAPPREPVKRNPNAIGSAEARDILFEITSIKLSGDEISVFVDMTNISEDTTLNVALYDANYRWEKSKLTDTAGKEYEVSQVMFWKGQQKTSMYDAGRQGVPVDARTMRTAQLIFKKVPTNLRTINKLKLHPYIGWRVVFVWKWQDHNLVFQNVRVSR